MAGSLANSDVDNQFQDKNEYVDLNYVLHFSLVVERLGESIGVSTKNNICGFLFFILGSIMMVINVTWV